MAWQTWILQAGQVGLVDSHSPSPHSMQKRLWPQGTRAAVTSRSPQMTHSLLAPLRDSAGDVELGGEGRATVGKDQMLDDAVAVSKDGESPSPSSLSRDMLQMDPKSPNPVAPELEELDEAELHPELPAENAEENPPFRAVSV